MKKLFRNRFVLISGLTLLSSSLFYSVEGAEFAFSVVPAIPENQLDKSKTYFDLLLEPGQDQTLEVRLDNTTEEDVVVESSINSAKTNINGVVEYGLNEIELDESLSFNLADFAEIPEETIVPAQGFAIVEIDVSMPDEEFVGLIAGGITFKEKGQTESESDEDSQGLAIQNEFSYVVALLMRQNEETVAPELNMLDAAPGQVNARNVINLTFQNPVPAYLNQLQLEASVFKDGATDPIYTSSKAGMQMAPNSSFDYPISLNGQRLEAGNYVVKVVAHGWKSEDGPYEVKVSDEETAFFNNEWKFEKEFEIKAEVAKELNEKDVTIKDDNSWIFWLIGGIVLAVLLLLLILFILRKKKKEENSDEKEKTE